MGAQSFACSAVTAQLHVDRKNKGLFFFLSPRCSSHNGEEEEEGGGKGEKQR